MCRLLLSLGVSVVLACGPSPDAAETLEQEKLLQQARTVVNDGSAPGPERADAHRRLARSLIRQGRLREAVAGFETAIELLDPSSVELAPTLNELSEVYFRLGQYPRVEEVVWRALEQAVSLDDRRTAATSWNNLGVSFAARGRPSAALEAYHRCLELFRDLDDQLGAVAIQHNLGVQLLLLGRSREGVGELRQVVATRRLLGDPTAVGQAQASLAWGLALGGKREEALGVYAEAVSRLQQGGAVHDLAVALEQRAQFFRALGRLAEARKDLQRSLALLEASGGPPPLDAAYLHLGLTASGQEVDAVALLREAVLTFDELGAQEGRILARLELARALRVREDGLDEAVRQLETAIEIVEAARLDLRLPSFRASFLGGWQVVYQELVDILASGGLAGRALEVAERARARSLLDRMGSAHAVEAAHVVESAGTSASGRGLRGEVEELEARALLEPTDRAALRRTRLALEQAEEVSRRAGPPSPASTPAGVDAIRSQLDADTVLLVYSLAPRRGWLWRLDARGVAVFPLPPGAEIEAAARNVHQLLPLYDRAGYSHAARQAVALLARQVLGQVMDDLGPGRLAVVPDGPLHLVPFGALVENREVVHLPSASTLVELRRRASRTPASRLLALVVDPVFEADDPRLAGVGPAGAKGGLERLPASAEEGARIADIARRAAGALPPIHSGVAASRELVTGGGLSDFRILHFATHGVVDAEDPGLAGLVLSLYDEEGPRDGLLRARDLHDLRLSADLVVLSACRTALGEEVRGEGVVGLADGFFAAGARHLVVSLWDVDDCATAELMVRFYQHLLLGGLGPAEALGRAQGELREETPWRSPAYWAAFVAVGDWKIRVARVSP